MKIPKAFPVRGLPRAALAGLAALLCSPAAHAVFLSGEALDTAADVLAVIVLIVVPIAAIVVFWLVHILPEKIAEKRHHPQKDAIKTLCLLSLLFGGLLWPLAWIFAYTKPVLHKMAYGTDKHDDYYRELAEQDAGHAGELKHDVARLRNELDALVSRGGAPEELAEIRDRLAALEPHLREPAPRRRQA
jgi:hypothetical protein